MALTKKALREEIAEILATGDKSSKDVGEALDRAVTLLMFHGASPSEFRGLSDTGLTRDQIRDIYNFQVPSSLKDQIIYYLDSI